MEKHCLFVERKEKKVFCFISNKPNMNISELRIKLGEDPPRETSSDSVRYVLP